MSNPVNPPFVPDGSADDFGVPGEENPREAGGYPYPYAPMPSPALGTLPGGMPDPMFYGGYPPMEPMGDAYGAPGYEYPPPWGAPGFAEDFAPDVNDAESPSEEADSQSAAPDDVLEGLDQQLPGYRQDIPRGMMGMPLRQGMPDEDSERPRLMLNMPWYFELIAVVITVLAISSLIRTFLLQPFFIPSGSMEKTLLIRDSVLVTKMAPRYTPLNRGDIVVFRDVENWLNNDTEKRIKKQKANPVVNALNRFMIFVGLAPEDAEGYLIKRVIGIGGDNVACCDEDGLMTINGKAIDEDYIPKIGASSEIEFNVVVPKGTIWVMGDNRNHSADSRYHTDKPSGGFVKNKDVVGRAFVVIWPMERMRFIQPNCAFYNIPEPVSETKDSFNSQSDETPGSN